MADPERFERAQSAGLTESRPRSVPEAPHAPYYVSVCVNVKDEELYLEEFIAYYIVLGVDHFFIYDNESRVPVEQLVSTRFPGWCTVISFPGRGVKMPTLAHFVNNFRSLTEWVLSVDADEFLYIHHHSSINAFVRQYGEVVGDRLGAICIAWTLFGFGGHDTRPDGLVIENYTDCTKSIPNFQQIKSLTRTRAIEAPHNAHFFSLRSNYFYVDALGRPFDPYKHWEGGEDIVARSQFAQVNHYYTRSREEYQRKMHRPRDDDGKQREALFYNLANRMTGITDTRLRDRFACSVRRLLSLSESEAPQPTLAAAELTASTEESEKLSANANSLPFRHRNATSGEQVPPQTFGPGAVSTTKPAWRRYLDQYPDLLAAGLRTEAAALRHWRAFGQAEGRAWPTD
ncbi:Glycosyltransferase family 2 [uncultured virus]|nr:Glycosyltransferase family 2 [uncultured virus]